MVPASGSRALFPVVDPTCKPIIERNLTIRLQPLPPLDSNDIIAVEINRSVKPRAREIPGFSRHHCHLHHHFPAGPADRGGVAGRREAGTLAGCSLPWTKNERGALATPAAERRRRGGSGNHGRRRGDEGMARGRCSTGEVEPASTTSQTAPPRARRSRRA
ncbi:forkhead box protein N3 [Lates japonicus]|uniref:Forkhead box protein N3 n=1 Tax=Lates japonicus TaxID=270547 RepID=A0AAD3R8F7_LATJO|nr:forkhead box protein N3 [Lates japonicus]